MQFLSENYLNACQIFERFGYCKTNLNRLLVFCTGLVATSIRFGGHQFGTILTMLPGTNYNAPEAEPAPGEAISGKLSYLSLLNLCTKYSSLFVSRHSA